MVEPGDRVVVYDPGLYEMKYPVIAVVDAIDESGGVSVKTNEAIATSSEWLASAERLEGRRTYYFDDEEWLADGDLIPEHWPPVAAYTDGAAGNPPHPSSQAFYDVLDEMRNMHDRKQSDYGSDVDPFANVRGSTDFGLEPWVGAMVRANDKMRRLQKAARGGTLTNEGIEDSLIDLAVYAAIGLVLFRQAQDGDGS